MIPPVDSLKERRRGATDRVIQKREFAFTGGLFFSGQVTASPFANAFANAVAKP
jgi:hypothetical protein